MSAKDNFKGIANGLNFPATRAVSIVASDTDELEYVTRAIYIGGDGDVKVVTSDGDTVIFQGLLAGTLLPIRVRQVYSTGTTATNMIALW